MKRQFYSLILCALCLSVRSQAQQAPAASGSPALKLAEARTGVSALAPALPANVAHRLREYAWAINEQRVGLPPFKLQEKLQSSSSWMAQDMAINNYSDHIDSLGRASDSRIAQYYGYNHVTGEILTAQPTTFDEAIKNFMDSPPHKAEILSDQFTELGIGSYYSDASEHKTYYAVDFGRRDDKFPLIINREKPDTDSTEVELYVYGKNWAKQMRLSNDGVNWSDWKPYAAACKWSLLPGSGERTVYVELVNEHGASCADQETINLLAPTNLSKK